MGQVNELKDFTRGQLDSALMRIGQDAGMGTAEGIRAFLAGKLVISKPTRSWRVDENGWIRFSLVSTGETGAEWADWYRTNRYDLGNEAEFMLRSPAFQASPKGTVYEVAVLPGKLWEDKDRITSSIRTYCDDHGLKHGKDQNPEVACLIRRTFSDEEIEEMDLGWIIGLHEPINDSDGNPDLFGAIRYNGPRGFDACYGEPGYRWRAAYGFVALVSPVSPQVSGS